MKSLNNLHLLLLVPFAFAAFIAGAKNNISLKQTEKAITLVRGETPILTYHVAEVPPPKGVDPIYNRNGFIYPLHAPSGGIVTGIHPADHYHHIGLWHAWVNTKYDGKKGPDLLEPRTPHRTYPPCQGKGDSRHWFHRNSGTSRLPRRQRRRAHGHPEGNLVPRCGLRRRGQRSRLRPDPKKHYKEAVGLSRLPLRWGPRLPGSPFMEQEEQRLLDLRRTGQNQQSRHPGPLGRHAWPRREGKRQRRHRGRSLPPEKP